MMHFASRLLTGRLPSSSESHPSLTVKPTHSLRATSCRVTVDSEPDSESEVQPSDSAADSSCPFQLECPSLTAKERLPIHDYGPIPVRGLVSIPVTRHEGRLPLALAAKTWKREVCFAFIAFQSETHTYYEAFMLVTLAPRMPAHSTLYFT
jgi:hypothetical protein